MVVSSLGWLVISWLVGWVVGLLSLLVGETVLLRINSWFGLGWLVGLVGCFWLVLVRLVGCFLLGGYTICLVGFVD